MLTRPIPSTGAQLPVIGCGTWRGFDVGANAEQREALAGVIKALFEAGGSVIDSSPMYGRAEGVVGDLLAEAGMRDKAFLATKVWIRGKTAGIVQMEQSMKLLRTDRIDLMQVHNLLDWQAHLATLRGLARERFTKDFRSDRGGVEKPALVSVQDDVTQVNCIIAGVLEPRNGVP